MNPTKYYYYYYYYAGLDALYEYPQSAHSDVA